MPILLATAAGVSAAAGVRAASRRRRRPEAYASESLESTVPPNATDEGVGRVRRAHSANDLARDRSRETPTRAQGEQRWPQCSEAEPAQSAECQLTVGSFCPEEDVERTQAEVQAANRIADFLATRIVNMESWGTVAQCQVTTAPPIDAQGAEASPPHSARGKLRMQVVAVRREAEQAVAQAETEASLREIEVAELQAELAAARREAELAKQPMETPRGMLRAEVAVARCEAEQAAARAAAEASKREPELVELRAELSAAQHEADSARFSAATVAMQRQLDLSREELATARAQAKLAAPLMKTAHAGPPLVWCHATHAKLAVSVLRTSSLHSPQSSSVDSCEVASLSPRDVQTGTGAEDESLEVDASRLPGREATLSNWWLDEVADPVATGPCVALREGLTCATPMEYARAAKTGRTDSQSTEEGPPESDAASDASEWDTADLPPASEASLPDLRRSKQRLARRAPLLRPFGARGKHYSETNTRMRRPTFDGWPDSAVGF